MRLERAGITLTHLATETTSRGEEGRVDRHQHEERREENFRV